MKKVLIAFFALISVHSFSQSPVSARLSSGFDLGMAYSNDHYNPSIAYYQLLNVGERKLFSLGWTMRLGAFYGDNLNFYTAPARLTRGKTGFAALSSPLLVQNIDTVRYDYVTMTSLNVGLRAQINLGRVEFGASADLLGLTLGKWRTGRYRSSTGAIRIDSLTTRPFEGSNVFQRSHPSRVNVRLLGDNDLGTLSTEVYARFHLTQRFALKAGYQWLTTETTMARRDVIADNNRFRHRAGLYYLALTLPIFY
ncbi:hypothetical protein HNV11_19030 [Spirosoma taeanense]|uniref:Outer membrane beta-barrel protein n=1 Tax=Spirosoma taeanense TaxID=2735870 RepID=A0A6M5YDH0_9BACT|nr:hypothetical protein [Spirosoma taeanense]QJW91321.1 hypothetical protein HNV11_19030 [Spirosoma taeanense]